jgi:hypothetical protein
LKVVLVWKNLPLQVSDEVKIVWWGPSLRLTGQTRAEHYDLTVLVAARYIITPLAPQARYFTGREEGVQAAA